MSNKMNFPVFELQKATINDAAEIAEVLRDGQAIKSEYNDPVWKWRGAFTEKWVVGEIEKGANFYYPLLEGAMPCVMQIAEQNSDIWGELLSRDALEVHKLAMRREYRGRGMGAMALNGAANFIADNGKTLMRIDIPQENEGLEHYYIGQGFEVVTHTTVTIPGRGEPYQTTLMQRPVNSVQ